MEDTGKNIFHTSYHFQFSKINCFHSQLGTEVQVQQGCQPRQHSRGFESLDGDVLHPFLFGCQQISPQVEKNIPEKVMTMKKQTDYKTESNKMIIKRTIKMCLSQRKCMPANRATLICKKVIYSFIVFFHFISTHLSCHSKVSGTDDCAFKEKSSHGSPFHSQIQKTIIQVGWISSPPQLLLTTHRRHIGNFLA